MTTRNAGPWIALAAVLVNGPRLVLIFLQADGITVPRSIEAAILTLTGIATGSVLTGGGMYIAHRLAEPGGGRAGRIVLAGTWIALLIFSVILIAPALLLAWRRSPLAEIIPASPDGIGLDVVWAVVAVLAVEVLAGGVMAAHAMGSQPPAPAKAGQGKPGRFGILADALTRRLAGEIEAGGLPGQPTQPTAQPTQQAKAQQTPQAEAGVQIHSPARIAPQRPASAATKEKPTPASGDEADRLRQRHQQLIAYLQANPWATDSEMAGAIGRAKSTAQSHRAALEEAGIVHRNGSGWEVRG
jgi:hypothetical protein